MPSDDPLVLSDAEDIFLDPNCSDSEENSTDVVIANGDPVEDSPRSVGAGREGDDEEDNCFGASFCRSTRIRRPNERLRDYKVDVWSFKQ